jgi:hypothetical protein
MSPCERRFVTIHRGAQRPMNFKPANCKRLQGAADAKRRARKRYLVLQVSDNKADAVPCERLRHFYKKPDHITIS